MSPAKREKCRERVHNGGRSVGFHPCDRYAVRDGWCKQHHPDAVKARRVAAFVRYDAQDEAARQARNERARETVRKFLNWSKWTITEVTERALAQWEQEPK